MALKAPLLVLRASAHIGYKKRTIQGTCVGVPKDNQYTLGFICFFKFTDFRQKVVILDDMKKVNNL